MRTVCGANLRADAFDAVVAEDLFEGDVRPWYVSVLAEETQVSQLHTCSRSFGSCLQLAWLNSEGWTLLVRKQGRALVIVDAKRAKRWVVPPSAVKRCSAKTFGFFRFHRGTLARERGGMRSRLIGAGIVRLPRAYRAAS